ncbi:helix-turn-helix domain-containing protein [Streptomyces sp. ACA25]|uniref:PucR family transcriptional regulator n=1 Tax=Streptomyces sp. ACA25 TaxID=3022596 RepID=UPI0023078067|nr:helix-turn-helix domain-containing protein [Streptomyces sp. ACA25]MDB1088279.1 helix-turn-helix domain-containing protein [Streptomyces sp. ACA25]
MHPVVRTRERISGEEQTTAVLRRSAQRLLNQLPQLTDRVVTLIQQHEPSYRAPAVDADALWQEVHLSLRHNVGCLINPHELRKAARRFSWRIGVQRAEEGLPLDALLHAFRLGGGAVWQELLDTASRRDPESMRLLVHVAGDVWNFVDEHCSLAAEAYRRTEREKTWRRENRLRLMTEALLEGTARVSELIDIAAALELPERGRYAVVVTAGPGRAAVRNDPAAAPLIWHVSGGSDLGIALLGDGGAEQLARSLSPSPARAGVRTGVSPAVEGLAAVGEARRLAEKALQSCPGDGEVALLTDHLPAALIVSSPELGAVLTERVLGPLLRLEPVDRDLLLDTLTVWLDSDASAQRSAERLSCHRNTVLNRLRRYEKLTGRSLGRPQETAELSLALTARKVLGAERCGAGPQG